MKLRSNAVSIVYFVLVLALSAVLSACVTPVLEPRLLPTPVDTPSPPTTNDLSVSLDIREPIILNQAVPVTITVESTKDVLDAYVNFYLYGPGNPRGTRDSQRVALQANQPLQIAKEIVFSQQGNYHLIATIFLPVGLSVGDSERVEITAEGGAVNPIHTYGPHNAVPAVPAFTPTPDGQATPVPDTVREGRSDVINATEGLVTLHGFVEYEARNGWTYRAKNILVDVYDVVGGSGNRPIGRTRTDSNGNWVLSNIANQDESGTLDVFYVFSSRSPESVPLQAVQRENGSVYAWTTSNWVHWDVPDGDVYLTGARVDQTVANLSAMWLLSDAYRSREFVQNQAGANPIEVIITWQAGILSLAPCGGACYIPIIYPYGVFIPDDKVAAADVVVHEIGHRYRHGAMGLWFFGDVPSYLQCISHGLFDVLYDSRCAFAEGWADYFPLAVNGDRCFDFETNGPCDGGSNSVDLEYQGWGDGRPIGDQVEGRVAGALYDVTDDNNEMYDDRWDSFWAVWTVLGDLPPVYTPLDFYASWMRRGDWALQAPLTMRFYNNTIEYFRTGLPVVLSAEGSSGIPATPTPTPPPTVTPTPFDSPLPTPTSFQSPLATPTPGTE